MLYRSYKAVGYGTISSAFMTVRYTFHSVKKRRNIKKG